jgi:hypothetical protein
VGAGEAKKLPLMPHAGEKDRRDYARNYYREFRRQAVALLGGQCACCGINDPMVLDVDHIHMDGAAERRKYGKGVATVRGIVTGRFPKDRYQLLCKNCNWRKECFRKEFV